MNKINTRIKLFFYTLGHNHLKVILTSIFTTIFAIPAFINSIVYTYLRTDLTAQYNAEVSEEIKVLLVEKMLQTQTIYNLINIACIAILFLGICGAVRATTTMVWREPYVAKEFFTSIKKEWKSFLAVGCVVGLCACAVSMMINIVLVQEDIFACVLLIIFSAVITYFSLSIAMFFCNMTILYTDKILVRLKNAFLFSIAKILPNTLILTLSIIPYILLFLFQFSNFTPLILVLISIYGFEISVLATTLYTHSALDKAVNKTSFPTLYHKGLDN